MGNKTGAVLTHGLLSGGVAAADDGEGLVAEDGDGTVADGAGGDAALPVGFLTPQTQPFCRGARRDDERIRGLRLLVLLG